ncbi:hypothetical protein TraAM80_01290 [Trypanosoma rangeli]|uniref:Uncharacterized protein n=1 Tax=Trypanosoma rangeli TaxID=5698 RepID=A0A3R7MTD5_TRYRA|nr:uncharacterized protein TraAM80_01290 [Trypanosoma rangeli]RNF10906.1 hypothetical protein TraAM80_01290 [Trypanosoma rangeli]|eukprot:RNF10906.1 hypothetical protein TraAM80_01290 [Trypanosoma rangeli]
MPVIYLQTGDGTRVAVPEGAGELSLVVHLALEIWAESHCSPITPTEDDADNICINSGSNSERTPDRILDEEEEEEDDDDDDDKDGEEEDDQSTCICGAVQTFDSRTAEYKESHDYEGGRLREPSVELFDYLDPPVGFLDDEVAGGAEHDDDRSSSRTPSVCPSPEWTPSSPTPIRGQEKDPRSGGSLTRSSHDSGNTGGNLEFNENAGILRKRLMLPSSGTDAYNEDSATPSTFEEREETETEEEEEVVVVPTESTVTSVQCCCVDSDPPPVPEITPPSAYAHPLLQGSLEAPAATVTSTASSRTCGNGSNGNNDGKAGRSKLELPRAAAMVVVRQCDATTVRVTCPSAVGEEAEFDGISGVPMCLSPRSLTNEEFSSPSGFHQRTPCMIGEDESLFPTDGTFSSSNEDVAMLNRSKEFVSPENSSVNRNNNNSTGTPGSVEASPRSPRPSHRLTETTPNTHAWSTVHSSSLESSNQNLATCNSGPPLTEDAATGQLHQCFIISKEEIVIEVQKSLLSVNIITPATEKELQSQSLTSYSVSQNLVLRHQPTSETMALAELTGATQLTNSTQSQVESVAPAPDAARGGGACEDGSGVYPTIFPEALRLCAAYLCYFTGDAGSMERLHPTIVPEPLSAPLVRFLTSWERSFLYHEILGQTEEETALAMKVLYLAPTISYTFAAPFLREPDVCAALLVKAPDSNRVALLAGVIRAARALKISSLENMCLAWCADYIIRASYASINCFEAAALLRQCFSVRSDWTKREIECLKLENEWPGNDEE